MLLTAGVAGRDNDVQDDQRLRRFDDACGVGDLGADTARRSRPSSSSLHIYSKVWTVVERKVTLEIPCASWVRAMAFRPDDTGLLLFADDLSVDQWDFQTQRFEPILPAADKTADAMMWGGRLATFSPDCQRIAFLDGERIRVFDLTTGSEIADLEGFQMETWCLAFSPDSRLLAVGPSSAAASTDIKLYSLDSGQETGRLVGHVSWIPDLCFTADGRTIVSAGADQTIRIWNVAQGREMAALHGHLSEIYQMAVSVDGNSIISGCKDGTILAWDTKRAQRRSRFETLPIPVSELVFLPDPTQLLSVDPDGYVALWDPQNLQVTESLNTLGRGVKHLLVSSDGTRVYAGTRRGEVVVLDWPTRKVITTLQQDAADGGPLEPAGLIDRDQTLVVLVSGTTVRLVDTVSWQTRAQWPIGTSGPLRGRRAGISVESGLLATGGVRGPIHFLNLGTGQARTIENSQPWGASDLAFSPDGRLLAAASLEGIIRLWDTSKLEVIDVLRGHLIGVNVVAFSPDGQRLASGSQGDEAVKLWDVPTRQEVATLPGEGLISGGMAFSPDGNTLVGINAQGKAHIWWAPSLAEIAAMESR